MNTLESMVADQRRVIEETDSMTVEEFKEYMKLNPAPLDKGVAHPLDNRNKELLDELNKQYNGSEGWWHYERGTKQLAAAKHEAVKYLDKLKKRKRRAAQRAG